MSLKSALLKLGLKKGTNPMDDRGEEEKHRTLKLSSDLEGLSSSSENEDDVVDDGSEPDMDVGEVLNFSSSENEDVLVQSEVVVGETRSKILRFDPIVQVQETIINHHQVDEDDEDKADVEVISEPSTPSTKSATGPKQTPKAKKTSEPKLDYGDKIPKCQESIQQILHECGKAARMSMDGSKPQLFDCEYENSNELTTLLDAWNKEETMHMIWPDEHIPLLAYLVQGSLETLSELGERIHSLVPNASIEVITNKIRLIAKRSQYGIKRKQVVGALEDKEESSIWRWDLESMDILPKSVVNNAKKRKNYIKNLSNWLSALVNLSELLMKGENSEAGKARVITAEEKVLRFERAAEAQRVKSTLKSSAKALTKASTSSAPTPEVNHELEKEKELKRLEKEKERIEKEKQKAEREKERLEKEQKRLKEKEEKEKLKAKKTNFGASQVLLNFLGKPAQASVAPNTASASSSSSPSSVVATVVAVAGDADSVQLPMEIETVVNDHGLECKRIQELMIKMDRILLLNGNAVAQDDDHPLAIRKHFVDQRKSMLARASRRIQLRQERATRNGTVQPTLISSSSSTPTSSKKTISLFDDSADFDDSQGLAKALMSKKKLFRFADNQRPAYFGTIARKPSVVNRRAPFRKEPELDYTVDSDDEWDEPEDGESLSQCSDDGEDKKDAELDYKDGWLMEDDVIELASDVDEEEDSDNNISSEVMFDENGEPIKKKKRKIMKTLCTNMVGNGRKPCVAICYDDSFISPSSSSSFSEMVNVEEEAESNNNYLISEQVRANHSILTMPLVSKQAIHTKLQSYSFQVSITPSSQDDLGNITKVLQILSDARKKQRSTPAADSPSSQTGDSNGMTTNTATSMTINSSSSSSSSTSCTISPPVKSVKKVLLPNQICAFLSFLEGKEFNMEKIITDGLLLPELMESPPSKAQMEKLIRLVAVKEKREGDEKQRWYVAEEHLAIHNIPRVPSKPVDPNKPAPKKRVKKDSINQEGEENLKKQKIEMTN